MVLHKKNRLILLLLILALSTMGYARDTLSAGTPENRISYTAGLSKQLFNGNRSDIAIAAEIFFREIVTRTGHESHFLIFDDSSEVIEAMQADKLDTIFTNPIDYLKIDHEVNPKHRYTITFGPSPEQRIYLLTRLENNISNISKLRGQRLTIPEGFRLGETYLEILLAKAGQSKPESFFSNIIYTDSSNAAVLNVFFNKADLAVTTDTAYSMAGELNPQVINNLRILDQSEPLIPFVIGVNKRVSKSTLESVDNILSNLHNTPKLSRILSLFNALDVVKINSAQIEAIHRLKREHDYLIDRK